jgi:hypothetical protein
MVPLEFVKLFKNVREFPEKEFNGVMGIIKQL